MLKQFTKITLCLMVLGLAACAKRPDSIAAIQMDGDQYKAMSCKKLAQTKSSTQSKLDAMSADQNSAATKDAWGVFLIGLPASSLMGGDREAAIAVAKGQIDAIELAQVTKDCI
ncbi:MAG: hypothetical protein ACPH69_05850 [Planktomarina sp.]|uniref:hypothetical protein n=1 Tax=Planktomarina sp. TaxID=2024851 RepID=UPI003C380BBD